MEVGDVYTTNQGCQCEIVRYNSSRDVDIRFIDEWRYEMKVRSDQLREGRVRNPYHPKIYGVGYVGSGEFKVSIGGKTTKLYKTWHGMLQRVYSGNLKFVMYNECEVEEEWHCFQNFSSWAVRQKGFNERGWHLDKDLLSTGIKKYCPECCVFVPPEMNSIFTGSKLGRELPRGIHWSEERGKYIVQCGDGKGVIKRLGQYDSLDDALSKYIESKSEVILSLLDKYADKIDPRLVDRLVGWYE